MAPSYSTDRLRRRPLPAILVAVVALAAIVWALSRLTAATEGLAVERGMAGDVPITIWRPAEAEAGDPRPAVVIAHGFAGSQPFMQPFATTLARNGYVAVTFDFPGHGINATPLPGGVEDYEALGDALIDALDRVVQEARGLDATTDAVAVIGHSMGADAVVRYARENPEIPATVAVSGFETAEAPDRPRNVLFVYGAWEPDQLKTQGQAAVREAAGEGATIEEGRTYGDPAAGTARAFVLADGVEHIGVLYDAESLSAARDWLDTVFDRPDGGWIDRRGIALALLLGGLVALGWPLARLLPTVSDRPARGALGWRPLLAVSGVAAVVTPLLLRPVPTGFLPILLGDYLALHFGVYGLITAAGVAWLRRRGHGTWAMPIAWGPFLMAVAGTAAWGMLAVGVPVDAFVFNLTPVPGRWLLIAALAAGTLPFFLADAWLTRAAGGPTGGYWATKGFFLLSLALAIALNLDALFFLIIIVPAILVLFAIYGLFSTWVWRRTGSPWPAAMVEALVVAWAVAVVFPVVTG
jgi:dienelactone hydrolase